MKRAWIATLALTGTMVSAQNLVPNGDFESYGQCPDYVSQIDRATGWQRPTHGTSDYFNACLGVPFSMSVPDNQMGDQDALSGNGYGGFYAFYETGPFTVPGDNDREYVTHELSVPLVPGQWYAVEFHVSLADVSKFAVDDLGALLSMTVPQRPDEHPITQSPQITHAGGGWLNEKDAWVSITGCLVADSAYRYITIGHFRNGANTAFQQVPTQFPLTWFSYYYVDDVAVLPLDPPALGPDLVVCGPVELAVQNPVIGAQYLWSTGEMGPTIQVDTPGTYIVQRTDLSCPLADTIAVHMAMPWAIELPPRMQADLCAGPIELHIIDLPTGASVVWSTGATTPEITVASAGNYAVVVQAPGHCPATATTEVIDTCAAGPYVPSAFTPNGDGMNDLWAPVWPAHPDAELIATVFDRWGGMVFRGARGDGWDGTRAGEPLPVGIYTYKLVAHDPNNGRRTTTTGSIALLR